MVASDIREYVALTKDHLRRWPPVAAANRIVKAYQLKSGLRALQRAYAMRAQQAGYQYSETTALSQARERIMARLRGRAVYPKPAGSLRVFWVGANRDQDESGFLQALRGIATVVAFRNWQGGYGQWYKDDHGRVRVYDPAIVARNDACLLSQIDQALSEGPVDVLMGQMWANYISASALAKVRERGVPVLNVSMDDRLPDNWSRQQGARLGAVGLTSVTDLVLTTSSETCAWFGVEGCPAVFWPLASDPGVFAPTSEDHPRDIDVLFIGNKYGIRESIVHGLNSRGIPVECYGSGWPNGPSTAEASAQLFKRARIILGVGTVGYCDDVFTLKLRDFDAPMSGALYLTHRAVDLCQLYEEGREIECYSDVDECARKIRYYLEHPDKLGAVASAGHARALQRDTWSFRLTETFRQLNLLS